jgi:hypothetical protein
MVNKFKTGCHLTNTISVLKPDKDDILRAKTSSPFGDLKYDHQINFDLKQRTKRQEKM